MKISEPAALRSQEHGPNRATFLELFFDLVFVFALTRISARAFEDLALEPQQTGWTAVTGGGKTLLLLFALWAVWQGTAWTTSRYDPHHIWLQTVVIIALVSSMVMGVATPRAFTTTALAFGTAYVVAQVSRPGILLLVLRRHQYRRLKLRMLITFCATGVLWIAGAVLPTNPEVVLWSIALALEYLAARFGWPVPGLGRSTVSRWEIHGEHLAERYQQFFLVALGETILVAGFSYSRDPFSATRTAAFAMALVTSILLWRIYVQRAGQILTEAVTRAAHPAAIGRSAADTHLVMVIGVVATAIGYELVNEHPTGHNTIPWIAMVLGGPLIFLAGRARFEYEVFGRVSPSRWMAMGALVALGPPLVHVAPLISAAAAALVLFGVAMADARRAWGRPPEAAAPPY
ncbi:MULTISPECIES: low temperature requirement protein A [Micromonospora]|uniref:Low temperature requirement protein A n=1 Tax=Micromonospora solifontis TaxID=2487138 RepID=A0ABX9WKV8_9ACTN|nr:MULTISPECIES: low temperature requirement protein A [Micromonospora]NES14625.1 low temperature requirement protein A [Micromonospora sp. PPF5-17B]NES35237.1 low temperature requirement protein A [Micromonospora solifontis]NES58407.1 low temperature requirement protein A [Micromonospora sp. PPF5-6]RNM00969.1 low temperature requirement protein A [Micromonospora solifontis]